MDKYERIKSAVFQAVDEVNSQLLEEQKLDKSPEEIIVGREAKLDSLALVNLIVDVESKIDHEFGVNINFVNEIVQGEFPFNTIGSLIEYLVILLEKSGIN